MLLNIDAFKFVKGTELLFKKDALKSFIGNPWQV